MDVYKKKILLDKKNYGFVFSSSTVTYDEGIKKLISGDDTFITVIGPTNSISIMFKQKIKDLGIYRDIID